jgi:phosphoglycolate phosphatase-like HAD superfamily hydrolase
VLKAVIFDLDGTLVDTVDFHAQSWERTFQHFGHQIPYEQIRPQIGKGSDQLLPIFFSLEELNESDDGHGPTFGERMRDYRRELYKREYHPRIKAFPQVRELFLRIKADGKRIALASSATKDDLATYKQIMNVEDLVDAATTTDEVESSKPEPDVFFVTLDKLGGIASNDVIVVGDTPYDAEAAGKINLRTIGVLCGGSPEENLRKAGCIAIYKDIADLLAHYDESPLK